MEGLGRDLRPDQEWQATEQSDTEPGKGVEGMAEPQEDLGFSTTLPVSEQQRLHGCGGCGPGETRCPGVWVCAGVHPCPSPNSPGKEVGCACPSLAWLALT